MPYPSKQSEGATRSTKNIGDGMKGGWNMNPSPKQAGANVKMSPLNTKESYKCAKKSK